MVTHTPDATPDAEDTRPAEESWIPVSEAARALGVSPTTVRRRITDGRLTARREPYRQAFRWLVQLPAEGAQDTQGADAADTTPTLAASDRLVAAVMRETDDELRAIAARVDLTRHAVVEVLERERTVALRQAALLEELASDPAADDIDPQSTEASPPDRASDRGETEGSRWALVISVLACLGAVAALAFLALPAWSTGIVGAVAVVAGLIAIAECFLLLSSWVGSISERRQRST